MLLSKQMHLIRNFSQFNKILCQKSVIKDVPKFEKLKINDKALSNLMLLIKSKKKLSKDQQIIVEGKQLVKEAVEANFRMNYLLFSHNEKIHDVVDVMENTDHVKFMKVPQQDLSYWSVLQTCPGLIGIFDKPQCPKVKENALPITVIADQIREPGNIGAIVRLANAVPITKVLMTKGCADPWEVKAIRGSSGSIFHMPTDYSLTWQQIEQEKQSGENSLVLIADNDTESYRDWNVVAHDEIPLDMISGKHIYVVIGGETHGISDEAKTFAFKENYQVVHIPLDANVNSLNTSNALAIILFELRRRLKLIH